MSQEPPHVHALHAYPDAKRWLHGPAPVLGLIGGMGSGKSWLASRLADHGAAVIDADRVGHELLEDPDILQRVSRAFPGVVRRDSQSREGSSVIDRKALAALVFSDPARLDELEAILHPAMRRQFLERIEAIERGSATHDLIVLDAAVLLEAGWDELCDLVVFVDVPDSTRHARLREGRGWSDDEIRRREASQWPLETKRARADLVVSGLENPLVADRVLSDLHRHLAAPGLPRGDEPGAGHFRHEPAGSGN